MQSFKKNFIAKYVEVIIKALHLLSTFIFHLLSTIIFENYRLFTSYLSIYFCSNSRLRPYLPLSLKT